MRISSAFPSPYLKAADLQGRRVPVKISRVEMQEFTDEVKPVVYFEGKSKGLVLNKTNANTISAAYGDETEDWEGKETVLYEAEVEYQGGGCQGSAASCNRSASHKRRPRMWALTTKSRFDPTYGRQCVLKCIASPIEEMTMMENDMHSGGLHQNRRQMFTRKQTEDARRFEFFDKVVGLNQQAQQERGFAARRSASRATAKRCEPTERLGSPRKRAGAITSAFC
jgi:hypothetical protein